MKSKLRRIVEESGNQAKMVQNGSRSEWRVARRAREAKMVQNGTRLHRRVTRRAHEPKRYQIRQGSSQESP